MNRAEIVAELERIRRLLDGPMSDDALVEARRGLEVLGETLGLDGALGAFDCPFEPGRVELVSLQSRPKKTETKTETKTKRKRKKKKKKGQQPKPPVAAAPKLAPETPGQPLTGRIAAMVREGVPTETIVALYRIKPEHVAAFVAAFVEPAMTPGSAAEVVDLTRCPTPL